MKKIIFLSLFLIATTLFSQEQQDQQEVQDESRVLPLEQSDYKIVNKRNEGFSAGLFWDQPLSLLSVNDSDGSATYDNAMRHTFGLCFTYKDFAGDFTLPIGLYLADYEKAESGVFDVNFYYSDNKILNHFSYKYGTGYFSINPDDAKDVSYYSGMYADSLSNSLYVNLLGDVSLRNIFIRNESQNQTKASFLGKIVLDHRRVANGDNIIPGFAASDFSQLHQFSGLSSIAAAPMLSGIVNFRFFQDNCNFALGLGVGPNFMYNYSIKGGENSSNVSISPKFDLLVSSSYTTDSYYVSVLGTSDAFITQIDKNSSYVQIDIKTKLLVGLKF